MFKIILVLHERGGAYELEYDVCCCVSRISFKTFVPLWKNLINYLFLSPWGNCNFIISYHQKYYKGFRIPYNTDCISFVTLSKLLVIFISTCFRKHLFSDTDLPRNFQSFRTLQRAFLVLRNISSQLDKRKQVDRRKLFRLKLISSCKRIMLLALQNCNFFLSPSLSLSLSQFLISCH